VQISDPEHNSNQDGERGFPQEAFDHHPLDVKKNIQHARGSSISGSGMGLKLTAHGRGCTK